MLRHDPLYPSYIEEALQKNKRVRRNFGSPNQESDRLFQAHHEHPSNAQSCNDCPAEWEVPRNVREDCEPQPHYGIIASGNAVVKHAETRDRLGADSGALCFEMESAGLMVDFPCIVIRGICDYSDSHKNKEWQGYAALVAAAYAKELLGYVPTAHLSQERLAGSICKLVEKIQEIRTDTKKIDQKIDLGRLEIAKGALFDSFENRMHDECLDGTRVELLQEVEGWIDLPQGKSMFWLNGMAGTGKSTISRTLATRLSQRRELGGSFFFKRGEEDRGNPKRLFTTLAQQLVNSIPELIAGIKRAIEEDPYISEKALGEQFDKLILQPILDVRLDRTIKRVIVIDALDECESNHSEDIRIILALLSQLQKSTSVQLRFFLTSRPELPIRLGFDKIQGKHQNLDLHKVQVSEITRDLALFLEHKFSKICEDRGLPPTWPGEAALQVLLARTVPLFISAATLCRFIGDSSWDPNKRLMMILTDRFAYVSKLESTYLPVLTQLLLGQDKWETLQLIEEFRNIVGVIIVVATPLSVDTISQLVDTPAGDITQRLDRLHSVLNVPKDTSIPVRLLHLSFRDFLSDQKTKESEASAKFWIDEREMHEILASKCLKTMLKSLKTNICNIPTYGTPRSEIDSHLNLWDSSTGMLQQSFKNGAYSVAFSPGKRLLASGSDEAIHIWDTATGIPEKTLDGYSSSVVFSPDGRLLASSSDESIVLWDVATTFSPNGLLASGSRDESVRLWDIATGTSQVLRGHAEWVKSVVFSPNGQYLASGSNDSTIRLWDTSTGKLEQIQSPNQHSDWVTSAEFSHNGEFLATSSVDGTVRLWDTSKGSLLHVFDGHADSANGLTFSADNSMLAFGCDDGATWLWSTASGKLHHTLQGSSDYIRFLFFSFDGTLLAVAPRNHTLQLWDTVSGELQRTFTEHPHNSLISAVAFSPSSSSVVSGSTHRNPIIWDTSDRSSLVSLQGHHDGIQSVTFSPDGRLVASGSWDCTIIVWQSSTGSILWRLEGHSDVIRLLLFSPDGKGLVSTSTDGTVRLWCLGTGQLVHTVHTNGLADRVEFSDDLLHLETNLGSISIPSNYDGVPTSAKKTAEIRLEETVWVSLHGKRSLWLPLEYRASCSKVRDNCLVVGTSSGRVLFMDFLLE
ncbi:hypothetical protein N7454_007448 [Penicillium verhagenii]|nr:hypothetical protein N7454_007448 [Penicillium verhagenii]